MNIKKLYYGLVSLISIIAIAISLGIIATNVGKLWLISDEEYLATHNYEFSTCKYDIQKKYCSYSDYRLQQQCTEQLVNNKKYREDIEKCKNEQKKKVLLKRYYYAKLSLISAFSTFIVFLILFLFHYSKFKKES